jgi:hypothetical protein
MCRQTMMSGYPVLPLVEHEFTHSISYKWFIEEEKGKG